MPFHARGCYVSLSDRGNVEAVLREYAAANLPSRPDGSYDCQCIVFSDGGRILGPQGVGAPHRPEQDVDVPERSDVLGGASSSVSSPPTAWRWNDTDGRADAFVERGGI